MINKAYSLINVSNFAFFNHSVEKPQLNLSESLQKDPEIKNKNQLRKQIEAVSVDELLPALEKYAAFLAEKGQDIDLSEAVQRLSEIIPVKKLEEAIKLQYPDHQNAIETAKSLLKEARYYLEIIDEKNMPFKAKLQKLIDTAITCLESVLTAFGVADFFKPLEHGVQASTKAQRVFALISLFGILTAALLPFLGATVSTPIVAAVILTIAALSLIYPHIKPIPHRMPKAINWSKLISQRKLPIAQINDKYLKRIAKALTTGKKVKTHPMLIGKSGVGKTETAKAFARAVENGEFPELKGKKVFYINSADLLNATAQDGANKDLQRISDVMGRHRKNIILVFDEIHVLCQAKHNVIAEQLKTYLDASHEGFPYVVGITTDQEFYRDIYRTNAAFARRFKEITIENPQDDEVIEILKKILVQKIPSSLIDSEALVYLLQKTKEVFPNEAQPAASIKILSQCIKLISENQGSELEAEMDQIRDGIEALNADNVIGQGNGLLPYNKKNREEIKNLEDQLKNLEEQFKDYQGEVAQLYKKRDSLKKIEKGAYKNIIKISNLSSMGKNNQKLLNTYLFQSHFLAGAFETQIRQKAQRLNVKCTVDSTLIDQVIKIEIDNQAKVAQALEEGKKALNARAEGE